MNLAIQTITEASKLLEEGKISSREFTEEHLERIRERDESIHAYLTVDRAGALEAASKSDERRAEGKSLGPLDGIPISIKDVIVTEGIETRAASKMLAGFVPPYDATVVARLKAAGAVILGKVNCDAWAHGSSTENSDFGPSKNPWDLGRVPGGSSGGSAAAVAAGLGLASIGTDTGGSIRQPAALCGVTGLKPTYGRLSRYGLIAMASSLDCPGPLARSAEDCALLFEVMAGRDLLDSTSLPTSPLTPYASSPDRPLAELKIGLPKEYFAEGLDSQVGAAVNQAVKTLEKLGATIIDVSLPLTPYALPAYYVIMPAEVSSNLARYDGLRYGYSEIRNPKSEIRNANELIIKNRSLGFGAEAKRRIMMGTYVLSSGYYDAYYKKAMQVRTLIVEDFHQVFDQVDVLATPTSPIPAWKLGEKVNDPLQMYLADIYTVSANLAGIPGISIPCGFVTSSSLTGSDSVPDRGSQPLPIGLQLLGNQLDEEKILRVAIAYQRATDWHLYEPKFENF
ncbi:Asp-tRNA(Asn)/Glu-tRNA(Gln) amidotransferase subunit GatA [Candidatus Berkelbacteria bacterium]|nr:Asp-tRNA(Asn)/Glu-tRNA(Gln) amidotransferase subunit GatA [Candidatus Berkelbacteria bacterium]